MCSLASSAKTLLKKSPVRSEILWSILPWFLVLVGNKLDESAKLSCRLWLQFSAGYCGDKMLLCTREMFSACSYCSEGDFESSSTQSDYSITHPVCV